MSNARQDEPVDIRFDGALGVGPDVEARLLVTKDGFSPRYDLDRWTGKISREGHDLEGETIGGSILAIDRAKGGVAAGWAMDELAARGLAPKAMVFAHTNPVFVQGCALAGIAIMEVFSLDEIGRIPSGSICRVSPCGGWLRVVSKT